MGEIMGKNLSSMFGKEFLDTKTGNLKTTSKAEIQKAAEKLRDLVGSKLSDKITKADTKSIHEEPTKIDYTNITTSKCAIGNIHITRKATANY